MTPLRNPRLCEALSRYAGVLVYEEQDWMDPVPDYQALELPRIIEHVGMVTGQVERGDPRVVLGVIGSPLRRKHPTGPDSAGEQLKMF